MPGLSRCVYLPQDELAIVIGTMIRVGYDSGIDRAKPPRQGFESLRVLTSRLSGSFALPGIGLPPKMFPRVDCTHVVVASSARLLTHIVASKAVAASISFCSVNSSRLNSAVTRPSHRTMMRSQTVISSGSSLDVMMIAKPWLHSSSIRR